MHGAVSSLSPGQRPQRPIWELLSIALPTVAQMASYTVMQFTDTWMLAQVGDVHATAAGRAGLLGFSLISFGIGVMLVVNTLVSQSYGRRDFAGCGQFLWQGVWTGLILGLLAMPLVMLAGPIFHTMSPDPVLAGLEIKYFQITIGAAAVKLVSTAMAQFMLAVQRPNTVLVATLFGVVGNIAVNWLLIYGNWGFPQMGVAGAAWGTNVAVALEIVVLLLIIRFSLDAQYRTFDWRPRWEKMRTLIRIGFPSGLQIVAEVLAWTLFAVWIAGFYSTEVMAATNYAFRFMSVGFMPAFGISTAVTALVGRYIGMGRPDIAARRGHLGFVVAAIYMICCGVVFWFFPRQLMGIFSSDPAVLEAGVILLAFGALYQFFDAMYIVYNGGLRGAGDTFVPAIVVALLCWVLTVGGGYVMAVYFRAETGLVGPWVMASIYGLIVGLFMLVRFTRGKWRSIHLERDAGSDKVTEIANCQLPIAN